MSEVCDKLHYDDLKKSLTMLARSQQTVHVDLKRLDQRQMECERRTTELGNVRANDILERQAQWREINVVIEREQKDIADLRKYILGNGDVENSMIYLLRKLSTDFADHIATMKKQEGRAWSVFEKVLVYLLVASISAVLALVFSGQVAF